MKTYGDIDNIEISQFGDAFAQKFALQKSQYAPGMYSFLVAGISIAEPSLQSRAMPLRGARHP